MITLWKGGRLGTFTKSQNAFDQPRMGLNSGSQKISAMLQREPVGVQKASRRTEVNPSDRKHCESLELSSDLI